MADYKGEERNRRWPRCIYLAGIDGAGKTTHARALQEMLQQDVPHVRYVWLRFPRLLCVPLLVYARLRGYSVRERVDGAEHGYWYFDRSWLLSHVFPWLLWLDTLLLAVLKVYVPLWAGYTIVCDRFVMDTLVDLMIGLNDDRFEERLPGRLFLPLLPRGARVVILDLDSETARQRSAELKGDRSHEQRRNLYLQLARRHEVPVVCSRASVADVQADIIQTLKSNNKAPSTVAQQGGEAQEIAG
jgi:thymidylate kinase